MARANFCYREMLPFAAMVMVEFSNVGLSTLFKAATHKGLSYPVFIAYGYSFSSLALLPLSYFFHRKTVLPPFSFSLLGRFFLLALFGSASQLLGYKGIEYSSPTLGSAMSNLTPACTFILAILFRMEKLDLRRLSSLAKTLGTIVSISGAFVVVLYNGPAIIIRPSPRDALNGILSSPSLSNWIIGGGLLAADYALISVWYIFQAQTIKEYPAELLVVCLYNICSTILCVPLCLFLQPNLQAWRIGTDIRLVAVVYATILGSGVGVIVHTWGLHVKGPVYVATFRPLSIAIAAVLGVIFLGDTLYLGCIIGAVVISVGFYVVLWGKTQEEKEDDDDGDMEGCRLDSASSSERVPFLKGHVESRKEEHQAAGASV